MAPRPHRCTRCKRTDDEVGSISKRARICGECAQKAIAENTQAMVTKTGPYYERWKAGYERAQAQQAARVIARLSQGR